MAEMQVSEVLLIAVPGFYICESSSLLNVNQPKILVEVRRVGLLSSNFGIISTGNELALVPSEPSRLSISIVRGLLAQMDFHFGWGSDFLHENGSDSALRDTAENDDVLSNSTKLEGRELTGLHILGNTCFMNSAAQCLVHTPPLVEYFLQEYKKEINTHKSLGMQGEIAIAFGELLRKL